MAGGKIDILVEPDTKGFEGKMNSKLGGLVGTAAKAGVGIAAALGGAFVTAGFNRLNSIDQAEAKLAGLGHTADGVAGIMDNALGAVKGTAFGLGEAAEVAASAVAANVQPGKDLERVLTLTGDAATIAGSSMSEMGDIFNKVATSGKIQGDVINQLGQQGIPILQLLADEMGVTAEEAQKMASAGEISFDRFLNAIETGMGGAALEAGETFRGSMDNLWAAVGRVGAEFLKPGFQEAPGIISAITDKVDELAPKARLAGETLKILGTDAANALMPAAQSAGNLGSNLTGLIIPAAGAWAAMRVNRWSGLSKHLDAGGRSMKGLGQSASEAQSFFSSAGMEINRATGYLVAMEERRPGIARMGAAYRDNGADLRALGTVTMATADTHVGLARDMTMARGAAQRFGGVLGGSVMAGMTGLQNAGRGLIGFLGGPWGAAFTVAGLAVGHLANQHVKSAAEVAAHKIEQDNLRASLDQTTGAITEQTSELVLQGLVESGAIDTLREWGVSQDTARLAAEGNTAAIRQVEAAFHAQIQEVASGIHEWEQYGDALSDAGISLEDFTGMLAEGGADNLERLNEALEGTGQSIDPERWEFMQDWFRDVGDEAFAARDKILGNADALEELGDQIQADALRDLADSMEQTAAVADLLGDAITGIPDDKTVTVAADAMTAETREMLEEMGIDVSAPMNGEVHVTFPMGHEIITLLDDMGVKLGGLPDGNIEVQNNSPEVEAQLEDLGIKVRHMEDGTVQINLDDEDTQNRLMELGMLAQDPITGQFVLTSNASTVFEELNGLNAADTTANHTQEDNVEGVVSLIKGELDGGNADSKSDHTQDDNVTEVRNRIRDTLDNGNANSSSTHTIYEQRVPAGSSRGSSTDNAEGSVRYNAMGSVQRANHGLLSQQDAMIAAGGSWVVWGEDETGGESFVPHHPSKRKRSTQIMVETADIFGMDLIDRASGEMIGRDGSSVGPVPGSRKHFNEGAVRATGGGTSRAAQYGQIEDEDDTRTNDNRESGIDRAFNELGHRTGNPYGWGATSYATTDCSGEVSLWHRALIDATPREARQGNTDSLLDGAWPDLRRGTDGKFIVGTNRTHMVAQLDGVNIESGGNGIQIGAGATSPYNLSGATLYYLPDELIVGGTGSAGSSRSRGSSSSYDNRMSEEEREAQRLEDMAASSQPRLARSNTELAPDPIVSAMLNGANDPNGVKELTRAGSWTERFGLSHNANAEDQLTEFLLWAYGQQTEPDQELARAFNADNDPTGIRSMIEAGVWTDRFGDHYRAGKDSQVVKAVHAARINGGYQTIRLRELQDELDNVPGSASELAQKVAGNAARDITRDVLGVLGHDDEFGPLIELGFLLGSRASTQEAAVDGSGRIVIEDTTNTAEPTDAPRPASTLTSGEADELQQTGQEVYDAARGTEQWRPEIERALSITGNPQTWAPSMEDQGDIESGGDPGAMGPNSSEGRPAGVWQVKPGTYEAYRDPLLVDDVHDVLSNGVAALNYMVSRYGENVWPAAAGYYLGGSVKRGKTGNRGPKDDIPAWLMEDEFVVNAEAARGNEAFLTALNDGADSAHLLAEAGVQAGTMGAEMGLSGAATMARTATSMMGPQGAALAPMINVAEMFGGAAIEQASDAASQFAASSIDGVANSLAQFVAGERYTHADNRRMVADMVPQGAAAPAAAQSQGSGRTGGDLNVQAKGYDRRAMVAAARELKNRERWESGFG